MQLNYKAVLVDRHFGFDPHKHQWFNGKKQVDSSVPQIFLIRAFKSCGVSDAGLKAELALVDAETSPELTFSHFKKRHLRREYGARVKGIDMFLAWAKTVGIDIGNLVSCSTSSVPDSPVLFGCRTGRYSYQEPCTHLGMERCSAVFALGRGMISLDWRLLGGRSFFGYPALSDDLDSGCCRHPSD